MSTQPVIVQVVPSLLPHTNTAVVYEQVHLLSAYIVLPSLDQLKLLAVIAPYCTSIAVCCRHAHRLIA